VKITFWFFASFMTVLLTLPFSAHAQTEKNLALVYKGPGSCPEECSESAAHVAELAGYKAVYVGPQELNADFAHAKVWIQPGGHSSEVAEAMLPELKQAIRNFVASGGAYVGFCAGGFYAGETFHNDTESGLGLLPGKALYEEALDQYDKGVVIDVTWLGELRSVYWEGGPYFVLRPTPGFEITAVYPSRHAAAVQGPFGSGRVAVAGFHPEAPKWWRDDVPGHDTDGQDEDIAVDMIRWATRASESVKK
jgi:glutamine amidotransferase-like uncharacterized protein